MSPIRVGISRCLLGDHVRYDGGHKRDDFLVEVLGQFVTWVPVCPEVESGMGVPREPVQLVGDPRAPKMMTAWTEVDHTRTMQRFSQRRVRELEEMDLCGYVFKQDSPSCGMERVRVVNAHGRPARTGVGLFARAFMHHFPLIPVEEEGRLHDPVLRDNFIERVFAYHRWQTLLHQRVTRGAIVQFHARHKYQLLAHSQSHYEALARLVGRAKRYTPRQLAARYGGQFMDALKVNATVRKHSQVLERMAASFGGRLTTQEKEELSGAIRNYDKGLTPLIVPITLIKHFAWVFKIDELLNQVYLNPHPKEVMLRNRA
jgi:uncharacterized protein YbbK (DUF523 family)/uncharacterized protein YbgA (DUF1722 family)